MHTVYTQIHSHRRTCLCDALSVLKGSGQILIWVISHSCLLIPLIPHRSSDPGSDLRALRSLRPLIAKQAVPAGSEEEDDQCVLEEESRDS